jgi:hypothetical protein
VISQYNANIHVSFHSVSQLEYYRWCDTLLILERQRLILYSAGAMAMGAHRSSLREDSQVSSAALALDIVDGQGMSV